MAEILSILLLPAEDFKEGLEAQPTSAIESNILGAGGVGEAELPGLTDEEKPRQRGPKRATKIRKLFSLGKEDDVRKYVSTYATTKEKDGKKHVRCPKIQRLITPARLQRKRAEIGVKRKRIEKVPFLLHAAYVLSFVYYFFLCSQLGWLSLPGCLLCCIRECIHSWVALPAQCSRLCAQLNHQASNTMLASTAIWSF